MTDRDSEYYHELQTHTGWGRTLYGFALWCSPVAGWRSLDVGCGPGLLPAIFANMGCHAVGVDLDIQMFRPTPLHPIVAVANVNALPFEFHTFDLLTASNLLFLLSEPLQALADMKRLLRPGGKLAMLNPSENLDEGAALEFSNQQGMEGLARQTLLNWSRRAVQNHRWTDAETRDLYTQVGLTYLGSILKVGPGFGRFSNGQV